MLTHSFSIRVFALLAAYALALQLLLLSMTPQATLAGNALAALGVVCTAEQGADLPAGQDHPPCAPDCLMASCGHGSTGPSSATTASHIASAEIRISLFAPIETLGRAITRTPQIPRAPPRA